MNRHLNTRLGGLLLASFAASGMLMACGTTIDIDKVEKEITTGYEEQDPGAKVESVSCPDSADAKKGTKFTCDFKLDDGSAGEVTVKIQSDEGDIRWDVTKNARNVLDVGKIEAEITKGYEKQVPGSEVAEIKCPDAVSGEVGAETICTLELGDGTTGEITVTTTDEDGGIEWEVSSG